MPTAPNYGDPFCSKCLGLVLCFLALVLSACSREQIVIDPAEHCRFFFPSLHEEVISHYRFVYQKTREGYVTIAQVIMKTNADYSFLRSFSQVATADSLAEEQVLARSMRLRAAALVGGENNLPIWFTNTTEHISDYFQSKGTDGEFEIWRSIPSHTLYLVAVGRSDTLHKK